MDNDRSSCFNEIIKFIIYLNLFVLQIPVACKTCGCGHKFITKSRANSTPSVKTEGIVYKSTQGIHNLDT